jgi:hypothetical protein
MSTYIVNISSPFTSYINYQELYKNSEALSSEFTSIDVSRTYLDSICSNNYSNVVSTRANYEFSALRLPSYDELINSSKTGIHLRREDNNLNLLFNTNETLIIDFIIITAEEVSVTELNTEESDYYNQSRDENSVTVSFNINNSMEDSDSYTISTNEEVLVFMNYYNNSFENVFAGITPLAYSCGQQRLLSQKTYFYSYGILEELNIIVNYGVEVWWE